MNIQDTLTNTAFDLQAQLFRALSHPVRLQILNVLARQEACVCHLTCLLDRPQPYVSQQLATLRDAGLVSDRRDGTLVYYRVADERISAWLLLGQELLRDEQGRPVTVPAASPVLPGCSCPRCNE